MEEPEKRVLPYPNVAVAKEQFPHCWPPLPTNCKQLGLPAKEGAFPAVDSSAYQLGASL